MTLAACAGLQRDATSSVRGEAMAAYENGNYARAADGLERYLERSPDDVQAWYRLGNARAQQERLEPALTAYSEALEREPGHARARYNHGLVRVRLGLAGIRQAQQAGDLDPGTRIATQQYLACLVGSLDAAGPPATCPPRAQGDAD